MIFVQDSNDDDKCVRYENKNYFKIQIILSILFLEENKYS